MAIENYGDLKDAIRRWLNREDSGTLDAIPDFIMLAEKRIFRRLRCPGNEQYAVYQSSDYNNTRHIPLPNDFLEVKFVMYEGRQLERKSDQFWASRNKNQAAGQPQWFARVATSLMFWPPSDNNADVDLYYYADQTLDQTNDTSATLMLDISPGLYLFGSLLEAEPFLKFPENVPLWQQKYDELYADVMEHAWDAEYAGSTVAVTGAYTDERGRGVFGI